MTTENVTPEEHSDIVGGSTAPRRIGCPRSYALEQLVPKDDAGSIYAREGTALHEMMAVILQTNKLPDELLPFTYKRMIDGTDTVDWEFTVDEDLWFEKGAPALAALDDFIAAEEKHHDDEFLLLIEQRVEFPGIAGAFGTGDIVGKCGGTIYVMDWKFGRNVVDVEENKQLSFYALGALNSCTIFLGADLPPSTPVVLAIIQPMAREVLTDYETTIGELDAFRIQLLAAVKEAQQPDARCQTGPWCMFARCKSICPEHLGAAEQLSDKFAALGALLGKPAAVSVVVGPTVDWTTTFAEMLDLAELVEGWAGEVIKQAHAFAEGGGAIMGRKLVAKTGGARSWAVDEEAIKAFFKNRKYKLDDYMPRKIVTMPQAEKILGADKRVLPEDMIKKPGISGYKLVREDVAGARVVTTAEQAQQLAAKLAKLGEQK